MKYQYSIFTKPYKNLSIHELAERISKLGFNAIEFPLRKGFQVEPNNAEKELPRLANILKNYGITITSVASSTEENIFAACASAGVKILRIMARVGINKRYLEWEADYKRYLENLVPLCEKYGVTVGIQNHFGRMASSTMELRRLIENFDPKYIAAVWDTAHSGLAGEVPEQALDIIWDKICLVNFKNAFYKPVNGPEAPQVEWERYFTLGRYGLAHYPRIAAYLRNRGYSKGICFHAEYTDETQNVDKLVSEEFKYVKALMED